MTRLARCASLAARTRAPKHSPGMFLSLCSCPFRALARRLYRKVLFSASVSFNGADDEARTRYLHLGKVALYQMSYIRKCKEYYTH